MSNFQCLLIVLIALLGIGDNFAAGAGSGLGDLAVVGPESSASAKSPVVFQESDVGRKIALLQGQLVGAPENAQRASLVHGALLWELGIIKPLYQLLITPERHGDKLYPKASISPLGELLKHLFYLAGGSLNPVSLDTQISYFLNPSHLGSVYKILINPTVNIRQDIKVILDNAHANPTKRADIKKSKSSFALACAHACTFGPLNPKNLAPTIIMAYFWAKYIKGATTVADASANLAVFNAAAGIVVDAGPVVESLGDLESKAIEEIKAFYYASLPIPIDYLKAQVMGISFADCMESLLRTMLYACFKNGRGSEDFYNKKVWDYFTKYNSYDEQKTQIARNEWAAILSSVPGVTYRDEMNLCQIVSTSNNVATLLEYLLRGLVHELEEKKSTLSQAAYLEQVISKAATMHGLHVKDFSYQSDTNLSWNLFCDDSSHIKFQIKPGHAFTQLFVYRSVAFDDPMLSSARALIPSPEDLGMVEPLVLLAAGLVQRGEFNQGYVALIPSVAGDLIDSTDIFEAVCKKLEPLKQNIDGWGVSRVENDRINNLSQCFFTAIRNKLIRTVRFFVELGIDLNENDEYMAITPFACAAESGSTEIVDYLYEQLAGSVDFKEAMEAVSTNKVNPIAMAENLASKPNFPDSFFTDITLYFDFLKYCILSDNQALLKWTRSNKIRTFAIHDVRGQYFLNVAITLGVRLEIVKYLCEYGADVNGFSLSTRNTPLIEAVDHGYFPIVQYLCSLGADCNAKNNKGETALDVARRKGFTEIIAFLESQVAANTPPAESGHPTLEPF